MWECHERKYDSGVSDPSLEKRANRSSTDPDSAHGILTWTGKPLFDTLLNTRTSQCIVSGWA